jgi:21S rRNA (GM2251-2'-O)-methyltransferase
MGTSLSPQSLPLSDVRVEKPTVLVLGNEGYGVRTNVARACQVQVRIEGGAEGGAEGGGEVDSLNVSVTGGILMHFLMSQRVVA